MRMSLTPVVSFGQYCVSAVAALRYGEIVAVIDASKGAGIERVGIVTEAMRRGARQ